MSRVFGAVLSLIFVLVFISSCGKSIDKKAEEAKTAEQWFRYIGAHTAGQVSKKSKIRVIFINDIITADLGEDPGLEGIIEIKPSLKGKIEWASTKELVFVPEKDLVPGSEYKVTLHLQSWMELPKGMKDYTFSFKIIPQDLEIFIDALASDGSQAGKKQILNGRLNTSDVEDPLVVEKIINAFQDEKGLKVTWEHQENGKNHRFSIGEIFRKESQSQVVLKWDGGVLGVKKSGERRIPISRLGQFKVVEVQPVQQVHQCILIRFSDPLDKTQNLRGLIKIRNQRLRFEIEGNTLKVYTSKAITGAVDVTVHQGIKNQWGRPLSQSSKHQIIFESISPAVRFVGNGNILPEKDRLTVPFEAVNLHSVQVTAFEVYSDNMGQFLQLNNIKGGDELERVGRYLWRKTIKLSEDREKTSKWTRYSLDVTPLLKRETGSLYRLILSVNRGNSTFPCAGNPSEPIKERPYRNFNDWKYRDSSSWDYSESYYNPEQYKWAYRNDPCHDAYYNPAYNKDKVSAARNFIASNIGIISKFGQTDNFHIITTDIRNATPLSGAKINAYNFQNQVIGVGYSDANGFTNLQLKNRPFYITAESGGEVGYLKVNNDSALPLSHFDVGGEKIRKGIKGYIYGERGVWRPGDTLYLTFVLEDTKNILPPEHPLSMELYNPKGQMVKSMLPKDSLNNFYTFAFSTDESALTGNWKARVLVGGLVFDKLIKIETVVPNRLKVDFDLGHGVLFMDQMPINAKFFSQWLHGADASFLDFDVKVNFRPRPTQFTKFQDYIFDDPAREFEGGKQDLFKGKLDKSGTAQFKVDLKVKRRSPGMLNASFENRVFEEGGNFSIDRITLPFHPYTSYVGIQTPKGDEARGMLLTDKKHSLKIATLNAQGNPISRDRIEVNLYKISWKWWWDKSGESLAQFASASSTKSIQKGVVSTKNGMGEWQFEVKYPSWGRYLIRACDPVSGHCTGKIIYIDWPGWAGRAREEKGVGATRLNFTADKKSYTVGEKAVVFLPQASQGRALVCLENGTEVISQMWIETQKGENKFEIELKKEMCPNIYVHVSLIQPHSNKKSDHPIRLYGVLPIKIENPDTRLEPVIETADEFKPEQEVQLSIKEKEGKAMTYTLAVVDEGLLGLTRFKTPDLRREFYKREALGVKTWDLFDDVAGAYGGELERILAIGGDEAIDESGPKKKRRFPPVVIFQGPFYLSEGQTASHDIMLPSYIGEVRIMVVAGYAGAYGSIAKSVPVRQDLMILSNIPRVVRPQEELHVPVSVFVLNPSFKGIQVEIETDEMFEVLDEQKKIIQFSQTGDKLALFKLKSKTKVGKGKLLVRAECAGVIAQEETFISIVPSNPKTIRVLRGEIKPGQNWEPEIKPYGLENTNKVSIEVSSIPPLNLEKRLNYLINYPHGCLEQTISRSFPQIYLPWLVKLNSRQKEKVELHIKTAIEKLRNFQISSGGFCFWPSDGQRADNWATNYAGHFLLEASKYGYHIPPSMLSNWARYQKNMANSWTVGNLSGRLTQAFRLYTLALSRKPDLGAMNRLRELKNLEAPVATQLAAAFYVVGQKEAAEDLIKNVNFSFSSYNREHSGTFGSPLRDKALILMALLHLGKSQVVETLVKEIGDTLGGKKWLSTQETAYALMAMASYYHSDSSKQGFVFNLAWASKKPETFESDKPLSRIDLKDFPNQSSPVKVTNMSKQNLYATIFNEGIPPAGEEEKSANRITLGIEYYDLNNKVISIDKISQGKDFIAEINVSNPIATTYDNVVLTHIFPSGWQIHNARFDTEKFYNAVSDYQDIRDDRIFTYFNLKGKGRKTFRVLLNSSFRGKYYLPGVIVEVMYDADIFAKEKGKWVEVAE